MQFIVVIVSAYPRSQKIAWNYAEMQAKKERITFFKLFMLVHVA